MKMRNYMKKNRVKAETEALQSDVMDEELSQVVVKKNLFRGIASTLLLVSFMFVFIAHKSVGSIDIAETEAVQLAGTPIAATVAKKSVITIPAGTVKANPFVPYRDISGAVSAGDVSVHSLIDPPEGVQENSDAARVMDTIVSGILFDKYNPSAILNIEGNDYLVKKGDVVNNYKVLNILQDSVTVKLGENVYKAGIGEILTEGTLNHNNVSNLSNKFGGEK